MMPRKRLSGSRTSRDMTDLKKVSLATAQAEGDKNNHKRCKDSCQRLGNFPDQIMFDDPV